MTDPQVPPSQASSPSLGGEGLAAARLPALEVRWQLHLLELREGGGVGHAGQGIAAAQVQLLQGGEARELRHGGEGLAVAQVQLLQGGETRELWHGGEGLAAVQRQLLQAVVLPHQRRHARHLQQELLLLRRRDVDGLELLELGDRRGELLGARLQLLGGLLGLEG